MPLKVYLRPWVVFLCLKIKSYLSGNPPIRLGLSDNLILGRRDTRALASYGSDSGGCCQDRCVRCLHASLPDWQPHHHSQSARGGDGHL